MLRYSTTQENIDFKTKIRLQNLDKKENFKREIKRMIESLQDELYQLENKQAKSAKLRGQKMSQNFLQSTWKTEYAKSNNIWILRWW